MAHAQTDDHETQSLKTGVTNLKLEDIPLEGDDNITLLCNLSQGNARPVVPEPFRREVFNLIHNLAHPGTKSTCKLISARFVWNGLNRDVRRWTRTCNACQQSKIHRYTTAPIHKFDLPDRRFDDIHVDIVGPLPQSHGFCYLFTCIDRYTRWTEAIPMVDMTAESCARALLDGWISRFGLPRSIMSDRGRQFESNLWASLMLLLGIKRNRTTAYHPQSNGIVERFHRQLKTSLKARLNGPNWRDELPIIMLGIRTSVKEDLNCSAAELVYGTTPCLSRGILPPYEHRCCRLYLVPRPTPRYDEPTTPSFIKTSRKAFILCTWCLTTCYTCFRPSRRSESITATTLRWTISSCPTQ